MQIRADAFVPFTKDELASINVLDRRWAWVEIDLSAIRHNVGVMRACLAEGVKFLAVVKADGYGHGAVPVARAALEAGADMLAVAIPEEGAELRRAGIDAPILSTNLSEDMIRETLRGTRVLAADPLFDLIAEEANVQRTVPFPHEACSGRMYRHLMVNPFDQRDLTGFFDKIFAE